METPRRKNMRLQTWDYSSQAAVHVIVCTSNSQYLFGYVESGKVHLSDFGRCCEDALRASAEAYEGFDVPVHCIMPNHVHMIVTLGADAKASLGAFVRYFKSRTTRAIREVAPGMQVWQRNYFDRVIRDGSDFINTWRYVESNPAKWEEDEYFEG